MSLQDRARGCFLGLAAGDALGRPIEFTPAEDLADREPLTEMRGDGVHRQPAGTITDDTQLALCIAHSLVENEKFDPEDIAERFVGWYQSDPFDIGRMTRRAINKLMQGRSYEEAGQEVWEMSREGVNAGNGSLMRCAPYAIAYRQFRDQLVEVSQRSSAITHADPRCTWGCATLNLVLARLIDGEQIEASLLDFDREEFPDELVSVLSGLRKRLDEDTTGGTEESDLDNGGYVVTTLEAGLFHGLISDTAEEAIINAVNMGGDTDTLGAVTGAVAGARFGADELPERWLQEINEYDEIVALADQLCELSRQGP